DALPEFTSFTLLIARLRRRSCASVTRTRSLGEPSVERSGAAVPGQVAKFLLLVIGLDFLDHLGIDSRLRFYCRANLAVTAGSISILYLHLLDDLVELGVETAAVSRTQLLDPRGSWSRPVRKPDQKSNANHQHKGIEAHRPPVELLESFLALGTGIPRGVDRGGERVAPIEHDQRAGQDHHRLNRDGSPAVFRIAERHGHEGRQGDRPRDRSPGIIGRKEGAYELAPVLGTEHREDDWHHSEREEQNASHPGRQGNHIDRVKDSKQQSRRHQSPSSNDQSSAPGRPGSPGRGAHRAAPSAPSNQPGATPPRPCCRRSDWEYSPCSCPA